MEQHVAKVRAACTNVSKRHIIPWLPSQLQVRTGTCVFVRDPLHHNTILALTCAHVVVNASRSSGVVLRFPRIPDAKVKAQIQCLFPELDLAILKVMSSEHNKLIKTVAWGDDTQLKPGTTLFAGGYALSFDDLQPAKLTFVARNRQQGGKLQCDGAANPGHSGGPVLTKNNGSLKLIGLIQSKASGKAVSNLIYVLPVSHIRAALRSLTPGVYLSYLKRLPFAVHKNTGAYNSANSVGHKEGVCIYNSKSNQAPNGSVLIKVGQHTVSNTGVVYTPYANIALSDWMAQHSNLQQLQVKLWNSKTKNVEDTYINPRNDISNGLIHGSFEEHVPPFETWGMTVCPLRQEHVNEFKITHLKQEIMQRGVLVVANVLPNSVMSETCAVAGDIVLEVDGVAVNTIEEYRNALRKTTNYVEFKLQCGIQCVKTAVVRTADLAKEQILHQEHNMPLSELFKTTTAQPNVEPINSAADSMKLSAADLTMEKSCLPSTATAAPALNDMTLETPCNNSENTSSAVTSEVTVSVQKRQLPSALASLLEQS